MRSPQRCCQFTFALIVLASLCGCGEGTGTVKGTVTYNNKPVDYGSVVFVFGDKQAVQTSLQPDGTYVAKGLPRGQAKVEVHSRPAEQAPPPQHVGTPAKQTPVPVAPRGILIPERYNNKDTSGLTLTVEKSVTEFNIELKDPE